MMKTLSHLFQSIACLWLAVGFASPLFGGGLLNSYRFTANGSDPSYSSVTLLLHCNGTNGSTVLTDNSGSPKTCTANGDAQIDTSLAKYGSGSLKLDGVGDYVSITSNSGFDFGTGDFTIEYFINFQGTAQQYNLDFSTVNTSVISITPASGAVFVYSQGAFALNGGSTALSANQWYHIALNRSGGTWTFYIDGVQYLQATGLTTRTFGSSSLNMYLGIAGSGVFSTQAHYDEIRIKKGVSLYNANFTPPAAAFPDS